LSQRPFDFVVSVHGTQKAEWKGQELVGDSATTIDWMKSNDVEYEQISMNLFRSNNTEIIAECRRYFQFNLPSELIEKN